MLMRNHSIALILLAAALPLCAGHVYAEDQPQPSMPVANVMPAPAPAPVAAVDTVPSPVSDSAPMPTADAPPSPSADEMPAPVVEVAPAPAVAPVADKASIPVLAPLANVVPLSIVNGPPQITLPNNAQVGGKTFQVPGMFALPSNQSAMATADAMRITLIRKDQSCGTVEIANGAAGMISAPLNEGENVLSASHGSLKIVCALNTANSTAGYLVFDLPKNNPAQF